MGRDIYPENMSDGVQGIIKKGMAELIPPIGGTIDAFYKEEDRYRFVGRTDGGIKISVDIGPGEMLADLGGLLLRVRGGHAEVGDNRFAVYDRRNGIFAGLYIEPRSRFRLKFGLDPQISQ